MSFRVDTVEVELLRIIADRLSDLNTKMELQNLRLKELIDAKRIKKTNSES